MITFFLILFLIGCCLDASAKDEEILERKRECRHRELMEIEQKRLEIEKRKKRRTRSISFDEDGRVVVQEINEE